MADCYSNYLRNKINDHIHGGPDFVRPDPTYFAAMSTNATASGGGTEAAGFSRVSFTNDGSNWPASASETKKNGNDIDFGTNAGSPVTVVGVAEYDAPSGGNLLTFAPITPTSVASGAPLKVPANQGIFNWSA